MRRDPKMYLSDARNAAAAIRQFTLGRTLDDFRNDLQLRSAVERQFMIIGEAFVQLEKHAPEIAAEIPDLRRITGFRNILVHGYERADLGIMRDVLTHNLGDLAGFVAAIRSGLGASG